jgi:alkaline phosphatase
VPDLATLARGALNVLDERPGGFFLLIEGGAVDWASHRNQSGRMLEEMIDFNRAAAAVAEWVERNGGWEMNLMVVTADHETGYLSGPWPAGEPPAPCRSRHPLANRGKGQVPDMRWNSGDHTTSLVPFFAAGRGSGKFAAAAAQMDSVRGPYFDNTQVGRILGEIAD